jgi:hypothetical protein
VTAPVPDDLLSAVVQAIRAQRDKFARSRGLGPAEPEDEDIARVVIPVISVSEQERWLRIAECPTPCDDDCELRPDGCHEEHQPKYMRGHQPYGCQDIRQVIGARVLAERERLYAELGSDHYVIFASDGWVIEHSVECRLGGRMHECEHHAAVGRVIGARAPIAGRWLITAIDPNGEPALVRADLIGEDTTDDV